MTRGAGTTLRLSAIFGFEWNPCRTEVSRPASSLCVDAFDDSMCRYHGRISDGDERIFAGVGSVPVLVVPGSSMEAKFHSDSSSNDWGYKFTGANMRISLSQSMMRLSYVFSQVSGRVKLAGNLILRSAIPRAVIGSCCAMAPSGTAPQVLSP